MEQDLQKKLYTADDLVRIIIQLRDKENGCPWDKVQTHTSIRKNFLEETLEALEAIDADDPAMMREELGDVLMQVVFHSVIEAERGHFTFDDVCTEVCRKLIFRHPHIYGTPEEKKTGIIDWNVIKNKEKGRRTLADEISTVPETFPALMKAQKLQKRVQRVTGEKPELEEAEAAVNASHTALQAQMASGADPAALQAQAGQYLFDVVRWLGASGMDAEEVLELYNRSYAQQKINESNSAQA